MEQENLTHHQMEQLMGRIIKTYEGDVGINFIDASDLPVRDKIIEILELLT